MPESSCSDICQPGTRVQPSPSECCWDCEPCEKGFYTDKPQMLVCTECGKFMHTDANQTQCLHNHEIWVLDSSPLNWIIAVLAGIGIVFLIVVSVILLHYRQLVVVKRNEFKSAFVVVTLLGYVSPLLHLVKPGTLVCTVQQVLLLTTYALHAVLLFAQTDLQACTRAVFKCNNSKITVAVLGTVALVLSLLTLTPTLPVTLKTEHGLDRTFLTCPDVFMMTGTLSAGYSITLAIIAGFLFERSKDSVNYNNFACYVYLLITSVFVPVYVTLNFIEGKVAVSTISLSILYIMLTGLKFLPSFYEIFVERHLSTVDVCITVTDTQGDVMVVETPSGNGGELTANKIVTHESGDRDIQVTPSSPPTNEVPVLDIGSVDSITPPGDWMNRSHDRPNLDPNMVAPHAEDEIAMMDLQMTSTPSGDEQRQRGASRVDLLSYV